MSIIECLSGERWRVIQRLSYCPFMLTYLPCSPGLLFLCVSVPPFFSNSPFPLLLSPLISFPWVTFLSIQSRCPCGPPPNSTHNPLSILISVLPLVKRSVHRSSFSVCDNKLPTHETSTNIASPSVDHTRLPCSHSWRLKERHGCTVVGGVKVFTLATS